MLVFFAAADHYLKKLLKKLKYCRSVTSLAVGTFRVADMGMVLGAVNSVSQDTFTTVTQR